MGILDLIYDWNAVALTKTEKRVELFDESLRDGLQSPSVVQPTISQKIEILHLMEELGIDHVNIGIPAAGKKVYDDALELAKEIVRCKMRIKPICGSRTLVQDIIPIVEISEKAGIKIEVGTFVGSSPIRRYTENWDLGFIQAKIKEAVSFAVSKNCEVIFPTEDTLRTDPETIKSLLTTAVESGARCLSICDTVGFATPCGVRSIIKFIREEIVVPAGVEIKLDWHGHSDRGLALANSLVAIEEGVDRVQGTALGVGERAGNAPMDLLLVNLKLMGIIDTDLSKLDNYCRAVSKYCNVPVPFNYPVVGKDAFRTNTGIHAAAIIKAIEKDKNSKLKDYVYSSVPAEDYGYKQIIEIGPMSGKSNVIYWLKERGLPLTETLVDQIFEKAKDTDRVLEEDEIMKVVNRQNKGKQEYTIPVGFV